MESISYASGQRGNPYWMLLNDEDNQREEIDLLGFTKIDYKLTNWLSAFIRIGADITSVRTRSVEKPGHHFYASGRMECWRVYFF